LRRSLRAMNSPVRGNAERVMGTGQSWQRQRRRTRSRPVVAWWCNVYNRSKADCQSQRVRRQSKASRGGAICCARARRPCRGAA
jgi:hypothetical protein